MTNIYHITHSKNLLSMISYGGIWCDRERTNQGLPVLGIAHEHIKARRARRSVPKGRGGTLADYVPFYFAPRSPMLFAISRNQVAGYQGTQRSIVHLVSSVERVAELDLPFVFTDGHADMGYSEFFEDTKDLDQIDWNIMKEIYWNDTQADGDRKRRRQAEFLVHHHFPWKGVHEICVCDDAVATYVSEMLQDVSATPQIVVRHDWYY